MGNAPAISVGRTNSQTLQLHLQDAQWIAAKQEFQCVEFVDPLQLPGATFPNGLRFIRCLFREEVDFEKARFQGGLTFWKCQFLKPVNLKYAVVEPLRDAPLDNDNGLTNFSWSRFEEPVDCFGAQFLGPLTFWRTVFCGGAKLESTFAAESTLQSDSTMVCFEPGDFADPTVFDALKLAGLLKLDAQQRECANMPEVKSPADLSRRLMNLGWTGGKIDQVLAVYARASEEMFGLKGCSFCGAGFQSPELFEFRNVDLSACSLVNSQVGQGRFQNVRWDSQKEFFGLIRRSAVLDERNTTTTESRRAVERLYHDLRVNFEASGSFEEAADFHVGELEMQRQIQPVPLRYISFLAWYRYLSLYGERAALALFWLCFFVLLIFPALYWLSGYTHGFFGNLVHSLETSTFLEVPKAASEQRDNPILIRFVTGLERIAVPILGGIFVLAVKSKFERR
jgi:Pentapeptide repeats (9 copies)